VIIVRSMAAPVNWSTENQDRIEIPEDKLGEQFPLERRDLLTGRQIHKSCRPEEPGVRLEADSSLEFQHTSRQSGSCRAEQRIRKRNASVVIRTDDCRSAAKSEWR
jgi:hypothetical protein